MNFRRKAVAVAVLASFALPVHADIAIDVIGDYEVTLQGLFQADGNYYDDDFADLNGAGTGNGDDTEFELRRAEVILIGKGTTFDWVVGYDAKADKFLDTNIRWKLGTAYVMAGQYKQPNSLEELTSTRNNDFISKAMTTNLFGVARRTGVAYGRDEPNWGFQLSAFGRELTRNLAHGSGYGARGFYAPINEPGNFLHLGVSVVDFDTDNDTSRLRVRPDADLATLRLIDTGNILNSDRQLTFGLETAYVSGPFKVQGEYMYSEIERYDTPFASQPGDEFSANSWYLYGLWNITGETWTYRGGTPLTPFPDDPSAGMWQLGLRYDSADLDDDPILGGEEQNLTLGVNWYIRSNFKLQFNYVAVDSTKFNRTLAADIDDNPNIVEARLQFHW